MEEPDARQAHVEVQAVVDGEAAEGARQRRGRDGDGADRLDVPEEAARSGREQGLELGDRLERGLAV